MKGITTRTNNRGKLSLLALLMLVLIGSPVSSLAQYYVGNGEPEVPVLTLTGAGQDSYEAEWYPNADIVTGPSANGTKYIYVPVFIQNTWEQVDLFDNPDVDEFDVDPIESFELSLLFQGLALKPVDILTEHPKVFELTEKPGTEDPCSAKDWHISYSFEDTDLYKSYLQAQVPLIDRREGKRLRITGVTGGQPLPVDNSFRVLLYVKFEVIPQLGNIPEGAGRTVLQILNDEIKYNDVDVTDAPPFLEYKDYLLNEWGIDYNNYYIEEGWPTPKDTYWNIPNNRTQAWTAYLGGLSNYEEPNNQALADPILPGVIYVEMYQNYPRLGFEVEGRSGQQIDTLEIQNIAGVEDVVVAYALTDPITDIDCQFNQTGDLPTREVIINNLQSGTRADNVVIETSADWLEVQTNRQKGLNFIPQRTRYDVIDYIDNGTLDQDLLTVDREAPEGEPGKIVLDVTCDPNALPTDPEREGIYEGYITLSSDNIINSPVRLKVTFIYYRAPQEGSGEPGDDCGVELIVENSNNPVDRAELLFGTADRATTDIDPLFGEIDYQTDISGFGARFYLRDRFDVPIFDGDPYPFGLSDLAPNDEARAFDSRDIRSIDDSTESIIYHVKFQEDGDNNYPITVSWDTRDFIDGGQYFIRDVITQGTPRQFPSVNMRTANNPSNQPEYIRTFTITDQRINEFVIEYTLPNVVEYVDENGDPIIKEGWNFLSLPVKPVNTLWNNIYRNAINEPIYFVPNTYLSEANLRVGRGYFIKYSDILDTQFAGSSILEISNDLQDSTRVFPGETGIGGWNSIGALSVPTCIEGISFEPVEGAPSEADPAYTRQFGVWRYNPRAGYEEVSELLPGLGYFIKVDANAFYRLETANCKTLPEETAARDEIYSSSEVLRVGDANDNKAKIFVSRDGSVDMNKFEMPPKPPINVFDARFNTNTKLVNTDESILNVQGVEYPLTLEINHAAANYEFTDALTGAKLGEVRKGESKVIEIEETATNSIKINSEIPEFDGNVKVYPNPVDDFMSVDFKTLNDGNVTVSLYSMVGLKVADLFDGQLSANTHNLKVDASVFNLSRLAEGRYILQITTVDGTVSAMVNIVRS